MFVVASLAWYIAYLGHAFDSTLSLVLHGAGFLIAAGIFGKVLTVVVARAMFVSDATLFVWRVRRVVQQRRLTP